MSNYTEYIQVHTCTCIYMYVQCCLLQILYIHEQLHVLCKTLQCTKKTGKKKEKRHTERISYMCVY